MRSGIGLRGKQRSGLRLFAVAAICFSSFAQNKPPNCTKNYVPPVGPTDANGKTVIQISILTQGDYGWAGSANGADPTVQAALTCAINMWNSAVGSNGQGIPYTFTQIENNSGNPQTMVAINKGPTPGSPVAVTANYSDGQGNFGPPSGMTLNPSSTSTDTTLCSTIAHELGHVISLSDAASGTIMGPVVGPADGSKWTNATQKVQKKDVDNVQFAVANRAQCKDVATVNNHENDSSASCPGTAPNESCFCDSSSGQYECSCDGSSYTCSDGSSSVCVDNSWQCSSVTTAQCDGPSPCDGAVCVGDDTWDTSQCTSVTTAQCDGDPPCSGATCSADNTWDTSGCNTGCTDECDPSCSNYNPSECGGSDPGDPGGGSPGDPGGGGPGDPGDPGGGDCTYPDDYCDDGGGDDGYYALLRDLVPVGGIALATALPLFGLKKRKRDEDTL